MSGSPVQMFHSLTVCMCQQGHCYVNYLSSVWGRVVVLVLSKLGVMDGHLSLAQLTSLL